MPAFVVFDAFAEAMAEKKHDFSADQFMLAMSNAANPPAVDTDALLADITEIAYTNCSSRVLTLASSSQTGGLYRAIFNDLTLTASGGSIAPFRYIYVYNNTAASKNLVGYIDYGSDLTLLDTHQLVINFDNTNGLFSVNDA